MASVTCARCRIDVDVTRVGRGDPEVKGDFIQLALRCVHRKDAILRATDLDCPDLQAAILAAMQAGLV